MTTITTKAGVIAADNRMDYHNVSVNKLHEMPDGSVIGGSGNASDVRKGVDYVLRMYLYEAGEEVKPERPVIGENQCQLLRVYPDGRLSMYFHGLEEITLNTSFFAIGSGSDYAMGAMAQGATAVEAVEIAAQYDKGTGRIGQWVNVAVDRSNLLPITL